jgi:hypothetical protein
MRVFTFFINLIYWLWLFIVPTGVMALLGFLLFSKSTENTPYFILLSIIGAVLGIWLAEYVRKTYGLDNFFARLISTPDINESNLLDDRAKRKEDGSPHNSH